MSSRVESIKTAFRELGGTHEATVEQRTALKRLLAQASPLDVAQAEQELANEGVTLRQLSSACDVHLELFREAAAARRFELPASHPISHFEEDHRVILAALGELRAAIGDARARRTPEAAEDELRIVKRSIDLLLAAENHNVRQENTLFPMLERHGIERPPAIMWQEHTEMRDDKKRLAALYAECGEWSSFLDRMDALAIEFTEKFASHTQKEQTILYPAALELFSSEEWNDIQAECDELGYFTDLYKEHA